MRVERIGDATLILGDCREILSTLGRVDAVVTDPPYGTGWTNGGGAIEGQFYAKTTKASWDVWDSSWITLLNGPVRFAVFCPHLRLPDLLSRLSPCWLRFYIKTNPRPGLGGADSSSVEPIVCAPNVKNGSVQHLLCYNGDNQYHPTEKPQRIMEWLITGVSDRDQFVLDPFMGSGTTGVACARLGRRFIGIEIEEKYFNIACRRVEQAYRQKDLFIDHGKTEKPSQQDLLPVRGAV